MKHGKHKMKDGMMSDAEMRRMMREEKRKKDRKKKGKQ